MTGTGRAPQARWRKKKKGLGPALETEAIFHVASGSLDLRDVRGLEALGTLRDLELDTLAFLQ